MAKKILIIDDEKLITVSLLRLLEKEGYSAVVAQNGEEALGRVQKSDFDLIVSDVRMPDLDGIATISKIRTYLKESGKKIIPEILITGYADADKYKEAMDLKVTDFLYKPFDTSEFLQIVKKTIQ